jgi:hypothetical protein
VVLFPSFATGLTGWDQWKHTDKHLIGLIDEGYEIVGYTNYYYDYNNANKYSRGNFLLKKHNSIFKCTEILNWSKNELGLGCFELVPPYKLNSN